MPPQQPPRQRSSQRQAIIDQQKILTEREQTDSGYSPDLPQPAVSPLQLAAAAAVGQPSGEHPPEPEPAAPVATVPEPTQVFPAQEQVPSAAIVQQTRLALGGDNLALQSLLTQLLNSNRTIGQSFFLVAVPDSGPPWLDEFADVEGLVDRVCGLLDTDTFLFPFLGARLGVTKGPQRHLRTPYGLIPLFARAHGDELELEECGFVGAHREPPGPPTSPDHDRHGSDGGGPDHDRHGSDGGGSELVVHALDAADESVAPPPE